MKTRSFVMSTAAVAAVALALAGCAGGSDSGDGGSSGGGAAEAEPVVGKAVELDLTKDAATKVDLTLTDTQVGDVVEVKQISTKFDPTNLTSFKSSQGDIVMMQVAVHVPENGYSVTSRDFGLQDDQDNTSSDLYAGGLEAAMDSQGFTALPDYIEGGSTKTGWVPLQIQDTAKSAQLTWKRAEHKDYENKKTYRARTMSTPLFTNTGASAAVKAAKEGAEPKPASATSTDDVTKNVVTVDQIITDFPLPSSLDYETGHIVALHVKADAGSVYTAGWSPSDLQLVTEGGDKVDRESSADVKTALAEKGFDGLTDDGYISSGESTTGWIAFLVKPGTGDDGFGINQHRDAANIIGGGSIPAADFPADITIG